MNGVTVTKREIDQIEGVVGLVEDDSSQNLRTNQPWSWNHRSRRRSRAGSVWRVTVDFDDDASLEACEVRNERSDGSRRRKRTPICRLLR